MDERLQQVCRLARAHELLHQEHRAERAKYAARMTPEQRHAFKAWERRAWWPRLQALDQRRHAADAEARRVAGYERPAERDAPDPLLDLRNAAKGDTRIEVDLEALVRGD